jgi:hypothetical protein
MDRLSRNHAKQRWPYRPFRAPALKLGDAH